ncbi:MAG: hypothetical protein JO265_02180 [Acidimicrobiia bacterium]|nr:hypothetical protein [Acidimicrobiia bacterium]
MMVLAIVLWALATAIVAVPVSVLLRHLDAGQVEEPIDPTERREAMGRHPSRRPRVA